MLNVPVEGILAAFDASYLLLAGWVGVDACSSSSQVGRDTSAMALAVASQETIAEWPPKPGEKSKCLIHSHIETVDKDF